MKKKFIVGLITILLFFLSPIFLGEKNQVKALTITSQRDSLGDIAITGNGPFVLQYEGAVNNGCYTIQINPSIPPSSASNTSTRCYTSSNPPYFADKLSRSGAISIGPFPAFGFYQLTFSGFNSRSNDSVSLRINVQPPPPPASTPALSPPATGCTRANLPNQCGGECNGVDYPSNHTISVTKDECSDGSEQWYCTDQGVIPGQCGNSFPSPTPINCPICSADFPVYHNAYNKCCSQKNPTCSNGINPGRLMCQSGEPCQQGKGCGTANLQYPPLPCLKLDDNGNCEKVDTAIGPIQTDPKEFVKRIFGLVLSLSGGIAVLLIIVSGYKLMVSQGNQEKTQAAREMLTSAIVGLLFIIFSLVILQIIGVDILKLPGFNP